MNVEPWKERWSCLVLRLKGTNSLQAGTSFIRSESTTTTRDMLIALLGYSSTQRSETADYKEQEQELKTHKREGKSLGDTVLGTQGLPNKPQRNLCLISSLTPRSAITTETTKGKMVHNTTVATKGTAECLDMTVAN